MTALHQYDRLEASGRWFSADAPEGRDVIISLGEASLTLSDPRTDRPLAHWSLASVIRTGGDATKAQYSPSCDSECVEMDDPTMIAAIQRIRTSLVKQPERRTMRWATRLLLVAFVIGGGIAIWQSKGIAARYWPAQLDRSVSTTVLRQLSNAGELCRPQVAEDALKRISLRALGAEQRLIIAKNTQSLHALPDGSILVPWQLIKIAPDESRLLGMLVMLDFDASRRQAREVIGRQLGQLDLLGRLVGHEPKLAPDRLEMPMPVYHGVEALDNQLSRFERSGISTKPWALSVDPSGEDVLSWIEADPHPQGATDLMPEYSWWAIRNACRLENDTGGPDLDGAISTGDSSDG